MQEYKYFYFSITVHTLYREITDNLNFNGPGHGLGSSSSLPSSFSIISVVE